MIIGNPQQRKAHFSPKFEILISCFPLGLKKSTGKFLTVFLGAWERDCKVRTRRTSHNTAVNRLINRIPVN